MVPVNYNRLPKSHAMEAKGLPEVCRVQPHVDCKIVYTDGSAYKAGGTSYAGWGIFDHEGNYISHGPLEGDSQTATRAEVRALVQLAETAGGPLVVYCDNQYAVDTANHIIMGWDIEPNDHYDLWSRFRRHNVHILKVVWVKAHMTVEEAPRRGFTEIQRLGNEGADEQAKLGSEAHGYTKAQIAEAKDKSFKIYRVQRHLAKMYTRYIQQPVVVSELKESRVRSKMKVRSKKRGRPFKDLAVTGHNIQETGDSQYCNRCGRTTKSSNKHVFWLKWRCEMLPTHQRIIHNGHSVQFGQSAWKCNNCHIEGKKLRRLQCQGGVSAQGADGNPRQRKRPRAYFDQSSNS